MPKFFSPCGCRCTQCTLWLRLYKETYWAVDEKWVKRAITECPMACFRLKLHYYTVKCVGGIKWCCDPSVRPSVCLMHKGQNGAFYFYAYRYYITLIGNRYVESQTRRLASPKTIESGRNGVDRDRFSMSLISPQRRQINRALVNIKHE